MEWLGMTGLIDMIDLAYAPLVQPIRRYVTDQRPKDVTLHTERNPKMEPWQLLMDVVPPEVQAFLELESAELTSQLHATNMTNATALVAAIKRPAIKIFLMTCIINA